MDIEIIPISKDIDRKSFDCGVGELNRYFRQFALPNDKKNIGKTFVATMADSPSASIGYYTVSMAQITINEISENMTKGLPKYPIPAMRIGKLAVDTNYQGQHTGAYLLKDALIRAVKISSEVALHFIIVDALNESAKQFYLHYGFTALEQRPFTLIISLKTIKIALHNIQNV